jgi:hypothetical protein
MKCVGTTGCGKELEDGQPYVVIRYWCPDCDIEHWVNCVELTEYIAKLHAEKNSGASTGLPDIL